MNITSLVGHSGGAATLTTTPKGVKIANFSLATVKRYKDSEGQQKKITDWHRIAVFGPQAEVVAKYVDKGTVVCVTGTLNNSAYNDKDGTAHASCTLHADYFEIMSNGKKTASTPNPPPESPGQPKAGDTCPKCGTGSIVKKTHQGKDFLACNRYPDCKSTFKS